MDVLNLLLNLLMMKKLCREEYIKLVERDYFGSVVAGDMEKIMACFTEDATVTIRHGDNPVRNFNWQGSNGAVRLEEFYVHLCGNFTAWFGDFIHYIDVQEQRCACTFVVKLTPKQDSSYLVSGEQTLRNCNFFIYRNSKIAEMIIYYSNSESRAGQAPTGYPAQAV